MATCKKCGVEIPEGATVCPACGEPVGNAAANFAQNVMNTADSTAEFDPTDIENNKILSLFAYLGILFLIPLLAAPNSKYARFHTNQGLVLFIFDIVVGVVLGILSAIIGGIIGAAAAADPFGALGALGVFSTIMGIIIGLVYLCILVIVIIGIVNAVTGKAKELPIIGKIKILK
ncbi:MAG: zinc-ribbon domain-containing protein [Eubacterium sp.]|nr:zinc-ribbon domain-containing protein [Eubacterium sp.]